ncbi:MAG: putative lipid II flippase FtsW [bacterium]
MSLTAASSLRKKSVDYDNHPLMARIRSHEPDYWLLGLSFLLIAFGLIMLSSAGAVIGYEKFGQTDYFLKQQLVSLLVGLFALLIMATIDYHVWRRFAFPILLISIALLIAVFLPGIGFAAGGAQRWIHIGSYLIQPSEIVKLTFLLYLAFWLEKRGKGMHDFTYGLLPFLFMLGIIVALVMKQPDLGTVSVIALVSVLVYFVAGAPWKHIATIIVGGCLALALLITIAPYRAQRITVFLNPELDPQGIGYHINQALLAIGSGGLFGVGLGGSSQKFSFLPEVTGDSIFAVIAEELGFILVCALLAVFVLLLRRGLATARKAPDPFGIYIAAGVTLWIVLQALINIGALSGILPLTGITLPFISSGGSSLVVTMAGVGLLLNISRQTTT